MALKGWGKELQRKEGDHVENVLNEELLKVRKLLKRCQSQFLIKGINPGLFEKKQKGKVHYSRTLTPTAVQTPSLQCLDVC